MGLRERERDPELPALAREAHLRPPDPAEICELVAAHLKRPAAPAVSSASWDYARWKPGISLTSVYTLRFADGAEEPVVAKRYVDGKDRTLELRQRNLRQRDEEHLEELCVRLRPRALLRERSLSLWVPPADRVLRGLPVLLDRRKLGNLVMRGGIAPPGAVKKRKTEYSLRRYKPERRAVYRLDLHLRSEEKRNLALAARAFPPAEAARVIAARTALQEAGGKELAPPQAGSNLRQGFLLEPWLELTDFGGDEFGHARAAGELLARLHAIEAPADLRAVPLGLPADLGALFAVDGALARLPRAAAPPAPHARVFCHGDFHPDQVARLADGRWILLDLDCLAAGDPLSDLANWIADWIVEHERVDLDSAAAELIAGYRSGGGTPPEPTRLVAWVAWELVKRAGSTLRRLEKSAIERARFALESAGELVHG
jgi:aminoglycoside phosphotransferase (APT) family kinase protein